jgi:hypothetical protein
MADKLKSYGVAARIQGLIEKAPAGGVFHDARQSEIRGGDSLAGRWCTFALTLANGQVFKITVEEVA